MAKTVFKDEGDAPRGGYVIWEYEDGHPVYQYTGYYRGGNEMILYPHHAIVKGTKRDKRTLPVRDLVRAAKR